MVKRRQKADLAKKRLTEANLRLVVTLAKQYTNRGLQFLDLVQDGNIGLMKAVEKFDYRLGYRFSIMRIGGFGRRLGARSATRHVRSAPLSTLLKREKD